MRLLSSAGLTAVVLFALPSAAMAAWDAGTDASAGAVAARMPAGLHPTSRAEGSAVTVDWSAVDIAAGVPVRGYRVVRTNAVTGDTVAASDGCAGVVTGTSCRETEVPTGLWEYAVSALLGDNWSSAAEYADAVESTGVPPLLARPAPSTSLPPTPPLSPSPSPSPPPPSPSLPATPTASPSPSAPSAPPPDAPSAPSPDAPPFSSPGAPSSPPPDATVPSSSSASGETNSSSAAGEPSSPSAAAERTGPAAAPEAPAGSAAPTPAPSGSAAPTPAPSGPATSF